MKQECILVILSRSNESEDGKDESNLSNYLKLTWLTSQVENHVHKGKEKAK